MMGFWIELCNMAMMHKQASCLSFVCLSFLLFSAGVVAHQSEPPSQKATSEEDSSLQHKTLNSQSNGDAFQTQGSSSFSSHDPDQQGQQLLDSFNEDQQHHPHQSQMQNSPNQQNTHSTPQQQNEELRVLQSSKPHADNLNEQSNHIDQDDDGREIYDTQLEEFDTDHNLQNEEDMKRNQMQREGYDSHAQNDQVKQDLQEQFEEQLPPNVQSQQDHLNPEIDDEALRQYELYLKELEEKEKLQQSDQEQSFRSQHSSTSQHVDYDSESPEKNGNEIENQQKEMTPQEIEAEKLYQEGEKLINATYYKEYKEAYLYFLKAAELNHIKAKAYVAYGTLFGDYMPQNITKASEMFKELAELGLPKSQMGLAFMYSAGIHFNSSQAKALIFLTFGALGGDAFAQMALGYRYYAGIGVESKCETALTYYRKVATKVAESVTFAGGPVVQRIRLQDEAESQGNNSPLLDDDLLQYYHFLADKGDQQAQIVLGTLYYQGGKGVQINHEQAYHYFSTAAESGNAHALGYLGKMHSEGSPHVKQSNQTAFEYFKQSADKNNHVGQAGLGMMYLKGLGTEKDTNKAFRFFSLASDQGSVDGQLQLGIMYFTGSGIRKDYKMAVKYFTLASQNGHVLAYFNLAQMHATGTGVLRNCHTAVELFKNVAERGRWSEMMMDAHRMYQQGNLETAIIKYLFLAELGYEVAQSNVAYILDNGIISKFEKHEMYQRALLQYSRAAVQGSTHARLKIGDYHYYGFGTEVDYESAASHYRIASEQQRNAQAMFNLGYMHERGLGMKQDVHLAKRFYDMAAETSIDAHVPVTLALLKLGLFYGVDVFSKEFEGLSRILEAIDPQIYFGAMWDVYLASVLAVGFTVLYFLRRMR